MPMNNNSAKSSYLKFFLLLGFITSGFALANQGNPQSPKNNPLNDYPVFKYAEQFIEYFSDTNHKDGPTAAAMDYLETLRSHWQIIKGVNSGPAVSYVRLLGDWFIRLIVEQHTIRNLSDEECAKYVALVHLGLGEILMRTDDPVMGSAFSLRGAKFYKGTYWEYLLLERVVQQCNMAGRPEDAINIAKYQFESYPQFEYRVDALTGNNYHILTLEHLKLAYENLEDHEKKGDTQEYLERLKVAKDAMKRYDKEDYQKDIDRVIVDRVFKAYSLVSNQ